MIKEIYLTYFWIDAKNFANNFTSQKKKKKKKTGVKTFLKAMAFQVLRYSDTFGLRMVNM